MPAAGFPRIGSKRQLKSALEAHWAGKLDEDGLREVAASVDAAAEGNQAAAGLDRVAIDGTLYDHVLDVTWTLGLAPQRFQGLSGLSLYFAMARGAKGVAALDMSKLYDTNYHYMASAAPYRTRWLAYLPRCTLPPAMHTCIMPRPPTGFPFSQHVLRSPAAHATCLHTPPDQVPELDAGFAAAASPDMSMLLDKLNRAQAVLGSHRAVPMLLGPVSYALLARRAPDLTLTQAVEGLIPSYVQILRALAAAGAPEVQLHEPSLATDAGAAARHEYETAYATLCSAGCPVDLVVSYDDLTPQTYAWVVGLPVSAISLDFCGVPGAAAGNGTLALLRAEGFPRDKRLGAGLVDGRSVWADDLPAAAAVLSELEGLGVASISVQPSTSLMHLPYSAAAEDGHLDAAPVSYPHLKPPPTWVV